MEIILAHCQALLQGENGLLFSVFVAGLVGSVTHCSLMCAPMVMAQMLELKTTRQSHWRIAAYHAGRITTYMLLGVLAVLASSWLFSGSSVAFTHTLLVAAGLLFLVSAALPRKTHHCHTLSIKAPLYIRGLLMGFIPCGMTLAVLILVATLTSPAQAALAMLIFGLATTPVLQLAGLGAWKLADRFPQSAPYAGRGIMALNGAFLCVLGTSTLTIG